MAFRYVREFSNFSADIDLTNTPRLAGVSVPVSLSRLEVLDAGGGGLAVVPFGEAVAVQLTDLATGDVSLTPSRILAAGTSVAKIRVWWASR